MSAVFHSLRWRLQLWHGGILLLAVLAFCLTAYRLAWDSQLRHIDKSLLDSERALARSLMHEAQKGEPSETPFNPDQLAEQLRAGALKLPAELAERYRGTDPGYVYFAIYDSAATVLLRSDNFPADVAPLRAVRNFEEIARSVGTHREIVHAGPPRLASIFGRDITPELESLHRFAWSLGAAGLGVWTLGLLGGWWLAGRAIKPIAAISRTATRIAAGNLAERIDTQGTDSELDQLGSVLNDTFGRLHETFEQQKRFTADASHELRTPITILLSETQRILKRERTAAEYVDAIRTCHDTAARMRGLVESLLLLARQEASGASAPREACDLAMLLRETVGQLAPLARERAVEIHAELPATPCRADPASLAILASNLVANAIQHGRPGGHVHVACAANAHGAKFSIRDDGPGIPAEDLSHVFERFYRVDKARSGSSGHAGLGLAIAKAVVDNHGGTITAANAPEGGAVFEVTLPDHSGPAV
jgi:heavy metal sensor kinase